MKYLLKICWDYRIKNKLLLEIKIFTIQANVKTKKITLN